MMPEAGIRKPAPERDDIIANHANVKKMTTIQEIKGDLFDVQEDAVLIRESPKDRNFEKCHMGFWKGSLGKRITSR